MKKENYDYTSNERAKKRRQIIKSAGLIESRVVTHKDDAEKVKKYAEKLYKKRGITLKPLA